MNLRPEFEATKASIMNREKAPDLDTFVQEVLKEAPIAIFNLRIRKRIQIWSSALNAKGTGG